MNLVSATRLGSLPQETQDVLAGHGFLSPKYGDASLSTIMPAIVHSIGQGNILEASYESGGAERGTRAANAWKLKPGKSTFLFVVDGLGYNNIQDFASSAPFLASLNNDEPAFSGFPSTTATSMSLIGTGTSAGVTGLVGYSALNPVSGEVGNFVSWKDIPEPLGFQRQPVLFEELMKSGYLVESIGLSRYNGSGMTQAALRGSKYIEVNNLKDTMKRALQNAGKPMLTHVYWAEIDKIGHHYGVGSREWIQSLSEFDIELQRFVEQLPAGNQVVVTADHGMINVDTKQRVDISNSFALTRGLRGLAGEPRCTHVYFNSMSGAKKAYSAWVEAVGNNGLVLTRDEVIDLGLYGPVEPHVTNWIGHLMILAKGNATVVDSQSMSPMALNLRGVHGSLTPTEVLIPKITIAT